jgi:hypothetical protein
VIFRPNRDARDAWWQVASTPSRPRPDRVNGATPGVWKLKELLGIFVNIEDPSLLGSETALSTPKITPWRCCS